MAITKKIFTEYIKRFDFNGLFIELGWNNDSYKESIAIDGYVFQLSSVAEKSGFKIMVCNPDKTGNIPDYNTRKKIEIQFTKLKNLHLIIFANANKTDQIWQLVVRKAGKPTKVTETRYNTNQSPELLFQRASGVFFDIDEEDNITIIDVTQKIDANFHANAEKVTKQFYDKFKKEHTSFLGFIKGIDDKINKEWYVSLMLNRLMFCYFIQKKGFLDNNTNYLRDKLIATADKKGKNKFYSFYRNFLLTLFHQGLGAPNHSEAVKNEIGRIPYLNGGLFDVHELETNYPKIEIDDKAFEKIFDFFDQYEWHLDTRINSTGKDINPDVIGFIFEKYINDRAGMGAYYTKEDITEYISKNCIIPFLFNETEKSHSTVFKKDGEIWEALKNSGDKYIYDSLKYGFNNILPETNNSREFLNATAAKEFSLPTETWREVLERKSRYEEVKKQLKKGNISSINDLITYNLNIHQFTQDVIRYTKDAEFLEYFYKSLNSITIIDPTCGSGAFLFAAMNILEPLYEECIERMENFILDAPKGKYKYFEEVIKYVKNIEDHPNLKYFIFKSIILRNLYGVDIMKEAVEIAKLRLFLKLVATVDADYRKPNLGLEPLPDIDFNIRSGNTLVGFATDTELKNALDYTFDGPEKREVVTSKMETVSKAFEHYKKMQLNYGDDFKDFKKAKDNLVTELGELNLELNQFLALPYGIDSSKPKVFNKWLNDCQPFHWFAEFYEIIHDKGGFDVVIGNPPYVEYSLKKFSYRLNENAFRTYPSRNLYSLVFERAKTLLKDSSRIGMIVQISSVSTPSMETMVREIKRNSAINWISNYATRPAYLFDGVTMNLTIIITEISITNTPTLPEIYSTNYIRWNPEYRKHLFEYIPLNKIDNSKLLFEYSIPKLKSVKENEILGKLQSQGKTISHYLEPSKKTTNQELFYRTAGGRYFKIFIDRSFGTESKSNKSKFFQEKYNVHVFIALLSSDLWWWYYTLHFDMYNCKDYMIFNFKFDYDSCKYLPELEKLGRKLGKDLLNNAERKIQSYETTGNRAQLIFNPSASKSIIEEIDSVLQKHYNLTDWELDYIVNYDIKYRLHKETDDDDE